MENLSVSAAWLGAVAFTFQIYFDFSGYSDMAIGLGKIFGFDYLENFNYPYISRSITEFWRRWHMSLSSWFKEYVYIPLGGNRKGLSRQLINISIVWILTGLWHGASWNFVMWGVYYGIILIIEKLGLLKVLAANCNGWPKGRSRCRRNGALCSLRTPRRCPRRLRAAASGSLAGTRCGRSSAPANAGRPTPRPRDAARSPTTCIAIIRRRARAM